MLRSPSVSIVHGIEDYINDETIDDMNRENNEELYVEGDREGFDKRDNIAQMLHVLN